MIKAIKVYGGVIFFYTVLVAGILLLCIKNNQVDLTDQADTTIAYSYND